MKRASRIIAALTAFFVAGMAAFIVMTQAGQFIWSTTQAEQSFHPFRPKIVSSSDVATVGHEIAEATGLVPRLDLVVPQIGPAEAQTVHALVPALALGWIGA